MNTYKIQIILNLFVIHGYLVLSWLKRIREMKTLDSNENQNPKTSKLEL